QLSWPRSCFLWVERLPRLLTTDRRSLLPPLRASVPRCLRAFGGKGRIKAGSNPLSICGSAANSYNLCLSQIPTMPTQLPTLLILFLLAPTSLAGAPAMEAVRISPDHKHFVLHPSGQPYTPWGHNYGSVDLLQRMSDDPARVERDFVEMKAAGTTV